MILTRCRMYAFYGLKSPKIKNVKKKINSSAKITQYTEIKVLRFLSQSVFFLLGGGGIGISCYSETLTVELATTVWGFLFFFAFFLYNCSSIFYYIIFTYIPTIPFHPFFSKFHILTSLCIIIIVTLDHKCSILIVLLWLPHTNYIAHILKVPT